MGNEKCDVRLVPEDELWWAECHTLQDGVTDRC